MNLVRHYDELGKPIILTTREHFLHAIANLGTYSRDGKRAIHKPLLILLALAQVQVQKKSKLVYPEIEPLLQRLITEFGTTANSSSPKAHYPFWYLQNDGFWQVENAQSLVPRKGKSTAAEPSVRVMRDQRVSGGFTPDVCKLLLNELDLIQSVAQVVLSNAFPNTLHLDVLQEVGLNGNAVVSVTKRDARFRREVLRAYSYSCVVCGYDGRLGPNSIGLEAAHIRWVQCGGSNQVNNGLAMCALHHKIFDMGGLTVDPDGWRLIVSHAFNGLGEPSRALHALHGAVIRIPPDPTEAPSIKHLSWHRKEVFRSHSIDFPQQNS